MSRWAGAGHELAVPSTLHGPLFVLTLFGGHELALRKVKAGAKCWLLSRADGMDQDEMDLQRMIWIDLEASVDAIRGPGQSPPAVYAQSDSRK